MSEISYTPPPPPPPPPAPPVYTPGFDFGKSFTFVFDDPRWLQKVLIGGLFYLAGFLIIGWFFILGYCARLARNVMSGVEQPLPEWDDLGDYFGEGLRLVGVILIHFFPIVVVAIMLGIPAAIVGAINDGEGAAEAIASGFAGCMGCLMVPISLGITLWLPAALVRTVNEQRFGAAFELGPIWQFIRENIGNYLLAILVYFVARFLGGFGVLLCCIGVIFTGFWSMLISTHAFSQVWRFRETR